VALTKLSVSHAASCIAALTSIMLLAARHGGCAMPGP
jgi:hypothetical protein